MWQQKDAVCIPWDSFFEDNPDGDSDPIEMTFWKDETITEKLFLFQICLDCNVFEELAGCDIEVGG